MLDMAVYNVSHGLFPSLNKFKYRLDIFEQCIWRLRICGHLVADIAHRTADRGQDRWYGGIDHLGTSAGHRAGERQSCGGDNGGQCRTGGAGGGARATKRSQRGVEQ